MGGAGAAGQRGAGVCAGCPLDVLQPQHEELYLSIVYVCCPTFSFIRTFVLQSFLIIAHIFPSLPCAYLFK